MFVSATATRNYVLSDPLLDYFKYHAHLDNRIVQDPDGDTMSKFVMNKGLDFEHTLVTRILKPKFGEHFYDVGCNKDNYDSAEKLRETIDAMKNGYWLIYQGSIVDEQTNTGGMPDLLVRSDMMGKLFTHNPLSVLEASHPAPKLHSDRPYHYVVIDIKFKTIRLDSNHLYMTDADTQRSYKVQLFIYNRALGNLQGYLPSASYILGRCCKSSQKSRGVETIKETATCLEQAGIFNEAKYPQKGKSISTWANEAVVWIRDVRTNGHKWDVFKPHREELMPNMRNYKCSPWSGIKQVLSAQAGELTCLWMVGVKNRRIAFDKGVVSWEDKDCSAETLGINGKMKVPLLNRIIQINQEKDRLMMLDEIKQLPAEGMYIDFETMSSVFDDFSQLPAKGGYDNLLIMIGVYYRDDDQWQYRSFIANRFNTEEEHRISDEFYHFVKARNPVHLFHWGQHEQTFWKYMKHRYDLGDLPWFDILRDIFKENRVVINKAFGFGIKAVTKALHGVIDTSYSESSVGDGSEAMVKCYRAECEAIKRNSPVSEIEAMKEIETYNRIDCQVLFEVMSYLRSQISSTLIK